MRVLTTRRVLLLVPVLALLAYVAALGIPRAHIADGFFAPPERLGSGPFGLLRMVDGQSQDALIAVGDRGAAQIWQAAPEAGRWSMIASSRGRADTVKVDDGAATLSGQQTLVVAEGVVRGGGIAIGVSSHGGPLTRAAVIDLGFGNPRLARTFPGGQLILLDSADNPARVHVWATAPSSTEFKMLAEVPVGPGRMIAGAATPVSFGVAVPVASQGAAGEELKVLLVYPGGPDGSPLGPLETHTVPVAGADPGTFDGAPSMLDDGRDGMLVGAAEMRGGSPHVYLRHTHNFPGVDSWLHAGMAPIEWTRPVRLDNVPRAEDPVLARGTCGFGAAWLTSNSPHGGRGVQYAQSGDCPYDHYGGTASQPSPEASLRVRTPAFPIDVPASACASLACGGDGPPSLPLTLGFERQCGRAVVGYVDASARALWLVRQVSGRCYAPAMPSYGPGVSPPP